MSKILITGSDGRFGSAIAKQLQPDFEIVPFDLSQERDATNYEQLCRYLAGCTGIVHMAFDLKSENSKTGLRGNPDNFVMGCNAMAAAAKMGVQHCIMGSSVNAARTEGYNNQSYRTTKLALEGIANLWTERYQGTQYTSVRLGSILEENPPPPPLRPDKSWISHNDVGGLVRAVLASEPLGEHQVMYGVSNRPEQPYDLSNPYGWEPVDWFGLEQL